MDKTIFDIMDDSKDKLTKFNAACAEMLRTKYILAETKISQILKVIATSSLLYSLFNEILADFDYKTEARNCIKPDTKAFSAPVDTKKRAALFFCLLLDIDRQNIVLRDFIIMFFDENDNIHFGYEKFLALVIEPFRADTLALLAQKAEKELQEIKEAELKNESRLKLEDIERCIGTIIARVNSDAKISGIVKDDLIVLCNELLAAFRAQSKNLKPAYQKLMRALEVNKPPFARELDKLGIPDYFIRTAEKNNA